MFLYELQEAFLESLRSKVRNGEITERSLAKLVGVSQPHLHHVLSGKRALTSDIMDRCLYQLRTSVLDLIDRPRLLQYLETERPEAGEYSYLPVLSGKLGPTHAWPAEVAGHVRFPVSSALIRDMWHPVVVETGFDVRMQPVFGEGDHLLLDQSRKARLQVHPHELYVIKRGRVGLIRRLHDVRGQVHMVSEDNVERPGLWEALPAQGASLLHFIRARARLIAPEHAWV